MIDINELARIAENWSGPNAYHIESASVEDKADAEIALRELPRLIRIASAAAVVIAVHDALDVRVQVVRLARLLEDLRQALYAP